MKKRVMIVCAIVAVVIAAVVGCGLQWFYSDGLHTFLNWVNFNYEDAPCYVVANDMQTVVGTTTLTIQGGGTSKRNPLDMKVFEIPDYIENVEYTISFHREDGEWNGFFGTVDGYTEHAPVSKDLGYILWECGTPVFMFQSAEEELVYIVPAGSEAEAVEIVEKTLDAAYGWKP